MGTGEHQPIAMSDDWRLGLTRRITQVRADVSFAAIDAFLISMAYMTALVLRFLDVNSLVPSEWWSRFIWALPAIVAVHLVANVIFGAYGHVWEFASVAEALRMVAASAVAGSALVIWVLVGREAQDLQGPIPLSVIVIGAMLTVGGMGAIRFRSRLFSFKRWEGVNPVRTLVVGTGKVAADLARYRGGDHALQVVGFVSPGETTGRRLAGLSVLGTVADLPDLVSRLSIDQVIVALDHPDPGHVLRHVVDLCLDNDTRLRILPGVEAVLDGKRGVRDVRDLEIADLLPRAEVDTGLGDVRNVLEGKRVLVTGAGGSIGAEIVRQVLDFGPAEVVALDHDETHLYEAMVGWSGKTVVPEEALVDIRDLASLERLFGDFCPDVVFHAAAHKHVPILENWPGEAVKTNVIGTSNVLRALQKCEPERFVLISTDKAVSPSSMMGASKRVAEMMTQSAAHTSSGCIYSSVRFGNVLGSRGSVVPTFIAQIQRGGPVTLTDPDMVRYFMTVGEAVQLVLQAAAVSEGGEVFVLDMGEPLRIEALAHRMIRLAGLVPDRDIEVEVTGARPGEKMQEILSTEPLISSRHDKVRIASPGHPGPVTLADAVAHLGGMVEEDDQDGIRELLMSLAWNMWDEEETIQLDLLEGIREDLSA